MEMRCYHKLLRISYKDHVTNEEVRDKIQQAIGSHEDLLSIVKRHKHAVVWICLSFIRSGQNDLARHSERGKKTRQTEQEVERQHRGMDRPGVLQVPEGSGELGEMEETGCEIISGAPTTLAGKGLMMMMMVMMIMMMVVLVVVVVIMMMMMMIMMMIRLWVASSQTTRL